MTPALRCDVLPQKARFLAGDITLLRKIVTLPCITPGKFQGCSPGILIDHVYALNEEETALLFLSPTAADLLRNHIG